MKWSKSPPNQGGFWWHRVILRRPAGYTGAPEYITTVRRAVWRDDIRGEQYLELLPPPYTEGDRLRIEGYGTVGSEWSGPIPTPDEP